MSERQSLYVDLEVTGIGRFRGDLLAAGRDIDGLGEKVKRSGRESEESFRRQQQAAAKAREELSTYALTAGTVLVAGLGLAVYANTQLQQRMLNVATISDEVAGNIEGYTDALVEMSTRLPQSANELAEGLYDVVSSGFQAADAMVVLEAAAMAASAGMTDSATAARVITGVLNAYGMAAGEAERVSDVLFQTVNLGVVSFEELALNLGDVVPTAAAAGVNIEEVGAALAAMTLSGIQANEASTALNNLLQKMLVPSDALRDAINELGYESGYAMLQAEGLEGSIRLLADAQGTAADTAFQLFPEIRAAKGYMALTAAEGRNYAAVFDQITDAVETAGAAQRAYNTQAQSDAIQLELLKNQVVALGIEVGTMLQPAFAAMVGTMRDFTGMLGAMPGPLQAVLLGLGLIAATGLVGGALWVKAAAGVAVMSTNLQALGVSAATASRASRALMVSLGVIGVALAAATAIYSSYSSRKREAKEVTDSFVDALRQEATGVEGASLSTLAAALVEDGTIDTLKEFGVDYKQVIAGVIGTDEAWAAARAELADKIKPDDQIEALADQMEALSEAYESGAISAEEFNRQNTDLARQRQELMLGDDARADVATYNNLVDTLTRYRSGLIDARELVDDMGEAQQEARVAAAASAPPLDRLYTRYTRLVDGAVQVDDTTKAMGEAIAGLSDPVNAMNAAMKDGEVSLSSFMRELEKQQRALRSWSTNLARLAAEGRTGLVNELIAMGPQAAGIAADAVEATDAELSRLEGLLAEQGRTDALAFTKGLEVLPLIAAEKGKATVRSLAEGLGVSAGEVRVMLRTVRDAIGDVPERRQIDLILKGDREVRQRARDARVDIVSVPEARLTELRLDGDDEYVREADAAKGAVEDVPTSWVTRIAADGVRDAINQVLELARAITGLNDKTVTVTYQRFGGKPAEEYANGGIVTPRLHRFGEGHSAFVAGAGSWRLFGEPETGGEAYIPLSPHKRDRSLALTRQVASMFGYDLANRGERGGAATVVVQQSLPDRVELVVDGRSFTAYVRSHARDVAEDAVGGAVDLGEARGRLFHG